MEPVIAFHLRFGLHELVEPFKRFIENVLVPKKVNLLIVECNTSFVFESHPEVSEGTLTKEDARGITAFCRKHGIRVVPLLQCLGHQGWGGARNGLLKAYPEFDETPHVPLDAEWPEIFCRSWCPSHPGVYDVVFDLIDELVDAFQADAFHIGMDEVYVLANEHCPRCKGKSRAALFADTASRLHSHLVEGRGLEIYMWGDRLNNSKSTGYDQWEGDTFGTYPAIDEVPKDIIILDWHYEKREAFPSIGTFLDKGFTVMPACWYDTEAAVFLLEESLRQARERGAGARMPGMVVTSWNGWSKDAFEKFVRAPGTLDGNLRELYETLDIVSRGLNKNSATSRGRG